MYGRAPLIVLSFALSLWNTTSNFPYFFPPSPPGKRESLYLTEGGREAFDQLYRLWEGEMRVVSTNTPSPLLPLPLDSQTQLVSDLLNVLIGVASTTFPLNQVHFVLFISLLNVIKCIWSDVLGICQTEVIKMNEAIKDSCDSKQLPKKHCQRTESMDNLCMCDINKPSWLIKNIIGWKLKNYKTNC